MCHDVEHPIRFWRDVQIHRLFCIFSLARPRRPMAQCVPLRARIARPGGHRGLRQMPRVPVSGVITNTDPQRGAPAIGRAMAADEDA